jgi:hypothetical protein
VETEIQGIKNIWDLAERGFYKFINASIRKEEAMN